MPAAGSARRLAGHAAGSKEILPLPPDGKPVCLHLLAAMRAAGIERAVWVARRGKEDIQAALGDGTGLDSPRLEHLVIERSDSVPETIAQGLAGIGDVAVALGFPDVIAEPCSALSRLVERFRLGGAEVVLGLFPTDRPDKADLVRVADGGRVLDILHKPGAGTGLCYTWLLAIWQPSFSRRLVRFVAEGEGPPSREPQVSDVLLAALADGLRIDTVAFAHGSHLDIGTPEDLERAAHGG